MRELAASSTPLVSTGLPAIRTLWAMSGGHGERRERLRYWVLWAGMMLLYEVMTSHIITCQQAISCDQARTYH